MSLSFKPGVESCRREELGPLLWDLSFSMSKVQETCASRTLYWSNTTIPFRCYAKFVIIMQHIGPTVRKKKHYTYIPSKQNKQKGKS